MDDHLTSETKTARWTDLFQCFRMSLDFEKVWHGALGLACAGLVLAAGLVVFVQIRQRTGGEISRSVADHVWKHDFRGAGEELADGFRKTWRSAVEDTKRIVCAVTDAEFGAVLAKATDLRRAVFWGLALLLLARVPWAHFTGAISRAAAVEYALGERLSRAEATEFARSRHSAYFWPPVLLGVIAGVLLLVTGLLGVVAGNLIAAGVILVGGFVTLYAFVVVKQRLMSNSAGAAVGALGTAITIVCAWLVSCVHVRWLEQLAAVVVLPIGLVLVIAAALLLLVLLFGRGLTVSAVSFESSDAFDAVTRASDYLLRRPWHLALYSLASLAYGAVCTVFVVVLTAGAFVVSIAIIGAGFGESFAGLYAAMLAGGEGATPSEFAAVLVLAFLAAMLAALVGGWLVSFLQCSCAIRYALMRQSVDGAGPSEIYLEPALEPLRGSEPAAPTP